MCVCSQLSFFSDLWGLQTYCETFIKTRFLETAIPIALTLFTYLLLKIFAAHLLPDHN